MSDQQLTNILAEMARNQALHRRPNLQQVTGLSQAILSGVGLQKPWNAQQDASKPDPRGPSFVNRILDLMSRPLYTVLNPATKFMEREKGKPLGELTKDYLRSTSPITNPQMLKDIWGGISGKDKTTGRDFIAALPQAPDIPRPAQAALAFGVDIAADPLTYLGGLGIIGKTGKAAKESTEALAALEHGAGSTAQTLADQISKKAARDATKLDIQIPEAGAPAPSLGAPPRIFAAGAGPSSTVEAPHTGNISDLSDLLRSSKKSAEVPNLNQEFSPLRASESVGPSKGTGRALLQLEASPQRATRDPLAELALTLEKSKAGKSELANISAKLSEHADSLDTLRVLNERIAATKSPIIKNLLRKEAEKVQGGIRPADILSQARVAPPEFPALSIGDRWVNAAREAAQSFLKSNRMKNINHVGQTNLYNKVLHAASKVRKDRRQFHVLQMLRIAEEEVLGAGRHLTDAEGISVRLSDVANMTGGARSLTPKLVDDFRKARPSQQVEDLKSYTTPQVASEVLDPVISTGKEIADSVAELPPSQTVMIGSKISRELMQIAERAGASTREAKTAKAFIDDLFNPARDGLYNATQQEARNLVRQSSTGIVNAETLQKVSQDVYKYLGANPKVLGRELQQSKVTEGIMTKFATWWGAKDLKPFSREYIDTARNVAAAFAETLTPLVRATKPSERMAAFAVAQGKRAAGSPREQELANQFKYLVQRLMGTHGITQNAEAVVLRSGTVMKELNDQLPKSLKLIEGKGTDDLGRQFDYTDGKWMHSWEQWDVKEPAEALYQLTRSLQFVTRKNAMWDDAAVRWGMPVKGAEFQHEVTGIPRLKGTYFPEQIATQLDNLSKQLDRDVFKTPNKGVELFDKVQRMWKTGVTIYSPSHHIRNLNGDIYLAALDGVTSPKPYAISSKVLHAYPTRYKDLESVFNIMDPQLREQALRARPGNVVLTTRHGDRVTAEQLYQAAESQGLFIRAMHVEDLIGDSSPAFGTLGNKFKPFGGRVYEGASRVSELRDHWVRLAHFADVLMKSNSPLRVAVEQAGRRVRKFHPDGMDMTGFEQNVLRRVIPFYSWMRKATPLVIEGAIMRPHITLAFPKAMADLQVATGIESEGPGDPFPMDQMFPDWLREKGIGPVLQPGSGIGRDETWRGKAPGYTIVNPTNPFTDTIQQLGNPQQTILSGLTPAARIPIELLTKQTSLGIPIENVEGGTPGYLAQQIPSVGIGARITGATRDNEPYNPEQLINWLTSAGITGTGPYQQQAQTELRQRLTQIAKNNRGDYR
jgi:hypothetical protein